MPLIKHSSTTNRTMIKLIMVLVSCVFYAADAFACHHTDEAMFAGQVQTFENQVAVEGKAVLSRCSINIPGSPCKTAVRDSVIVLGGCAHILLLFPVISPSNQ